LYPLEMKLRERVSLVAKEVYGADGVAWTPEAEAKAKMLEADSKYDEYATMMVKTHLSLTHDPAVKGVPKGWILPVRDIFHLLGIKVPLPGPWAKSLIAGDFSRPGFPQMGVGGKTGKVTGLF